MSFVSELRRRNVFRVATGYALVAWIMIEAGSVLLPEFFGAPDWFFKVYVMLVFAGFVLALIFAWVFEITPEGVRLESSLDREDYVRPPRSGWNMGLIILLVIALGVSLTFNVTGIRTAEQPTIAGRSDASLAVLPFANTSADPEDQSFADGLHGDLLSRLSRIDSLHVISRTSVNEYRNTNKNLKQIAGELDVGTIVEGSVQRAGSQVRINVSLIDAGSEVVLWSSTFDRRMTVEDLFAVQTEISREIAGILEATLTPDDRVYLASIPTSDIEAFTLYAEATQNIVERTFESLTIAREQFEAAIAVDEQFAKAHAGRAKAVLLLFINHEGISQADAFRITAESAERALELDERLAEAHAVRGLLLFKQWEVTRIGDRITEAAAALQRAIELDSSYTDAYVWLSTIREAEGRTGEAVELLTTAVAKDPRSRIPYLNLPGLLAQHGRSDESLELLVKAIRLFPDWSSPYDNLAQTLLRLGRIDEGVAWHTLGAEVTTDPLFEGGLNGVYLAFDQPERLVAFLDSIPEGHPLFPLVDGYREVLEGDMDDGLRLLLEQYDESAPSLLKQFLSRRLVIAGRYAEAQSILLDHSPTLGLDRARVVDRYNVADAIVLAYILRQLGNEAEATSLLLEAQEVIAGIPRLGKPGHGIADVFVLSQLGQKDFAINALRAAVDDGFTNLWIYDSWALEETPLLDPIRSDPRFIQIESELDERIDRFRTIVEAAESSGDWSPILAKLDPARSEST